jgi:hypothetical protein
VKAHLEEASRRIDLWQGKFTVFDPEDLRSTIAAFSKQEHADLFVRALEQLEPKPKRERLGRGDLVVVTAKFGGAT